MAISEFTESNTNTGQWAPITTSAVGGTTKYGIKVTSVRYPRYTFQNEAFYPNTTQGSIAIVELYANSETTDGVALTHVSAANIPQQSLSSNTAIYGISADTKEKYYVYNFTDKGYANTKKMSVSGNKKRKVFAIRSWGSIGQDYNKPYIAFIGDGSILNYNGITTGYSVGCAGVTKISAADTWVGHIAGDGTRYYSITNNTINLNKYTAIPLTAGHTYRFTLHASSEAGNDGVAICNTSNSKAFKDLTASDLLSGSTSTGKCSGLDATTTFTYTVPASVGASGITKYIYFKSNSSILGSLIEGTDTHGNTTHYRDSRSFADVMVEDLGDLRKEQPAPTAANVTVEYGNTAAASVSVSGGGYGKLQYRTYAVSHFSSWSTTVPIRTEIGETTYQARYSGNDSYQASPISNTATLTVTPIHVTKPTAKTGLVYGTGYDERLGLPFQTGVNGIPNTSIATASGEGRGKYAGNYSVTYTLKDTAHYCWDDGTTAPVTVNWSIAPRPVRLRWGTTSWIYDGTAHSTTCEAPFLIGNDTCEVYLEGNSITDVGSKEVYASLSNSNYTTAGSNTATLTVVAKEVVLNWGTTSWIYDGTTHSTTCAVSNLIGSDSCTVILSGNSITDVGSTTVTATALSNSNYKLPANNTATLTINPCMYFKKNGSWVPVKEIYKKVNGAWVKQTTSAKIGNAFSSGGKYLGRYLDGSTWKNLINENT